MRVTPQNDIRRLFPVLRELDISPQQILVIALLTLALVILEGAGMGMLLPILVFIEQGEVGLSQAAGAKLGWLSDAVTAIGLPMSLPSLLLLAVIPLLLRQVVFHAKNLATAKAQFDYQSRARYRYIKSFLRAGLPFYLKTSESSILTALQVDTDRSTVIVKSAVDIAGSIFILSVYLCLLLYISTALTLIALPLFLASAFMVRRYLATGRSIGQDIGGLNQSFGQSVSDVLRGIRIVKMRGLETEESEKLRTQAEILSKRQIALQRIGSLMQAAAQPVLILGVFGILYLAVIEFEMRLAELGMFLFLTTRAVPQLIQINTLRLNFNGGIESHYRASRLAIEADAAQDVPTGGRPLLRFNEIVFENVSFSYWRDGIEIPALLDIDVALSKGQMIALVGASGAGKSTFADLVARFYDPTSGRILIDGCPATEFDVRSLRRKIGFVTQDNVFFNNTIRANIEAGLGRRLSDEKLKWCLEMSHAQEFIEQLPKGVETLVGERGQQLSGGQRQRLALARALAQEPEILILDEPTSALDSLSEQAIQNSLERLRSKLTILVIAHRLSTIRNADVIVVLSEGRIIGCGTHDSLYQRDGAYKDMVELQRA
jgi:ABC-type multidrug transport system fused ATPase/permease subunit